MALYLVVKAYVNEIPVLEPCRLQDGAKVTVELITSNQVIFCCPASATKNGQPEPLTKGRQTRLIFPANTRTRVYSFQDLV